MSIEIVTAVDERFRYRSPYWRPGMSVMVEPYSVLGEANTGHLLLPGHRDPVRARAELRRWQILAERGMPVLGPHRVVSAVLVDPRGDVIDQWSLPGQPTPVPGGAPRWSQLLRVAEMTECLSCREPRWPGTWVGRDVPGCVACLPDRETADPRPDWPHEPDRPPDAPVKAKRKGSRKADAVADEAAGSLVTGVDSPDPDRLF